MMKLFGSIKLSAQLSKTTGQQYSLTQKYMYRTYKSYQVGNVYLSYNLIGNIGDQLIINVTQTLRHSCNIRTFREEDILGELRLVAGYFFEINIAHGIDELKAEVYTLERQDSRRQHI